MEEKNNKRKIVILISAVIALLVLLIGITYAYFSARSVSTEQTVTTQNLGLEFDDSTAIINAQNISPIVREEMLTKAAKKTFTITNTGGKSYVKISLEDVILPDALKRYDFMWSLYEGDKNVSNGSFEYAEDTVTLAEYQVFDAPASLGGTESNTKTYNLYIWIEETNLDQNLMKGQTFSATITADATAYYTTAESDFTFDSATGTITAYTGTETDIVIPSTISGVAVTTIGKELFCEKQLTSVIIPNSVTSIESYAFAYTQLTSVVIPNSIVTIGEGIFEGATLTEVTIPNSITSIGDYAFYDNQLSSVVIPNSVVSIGDSTFSKNNISNLIIPNSITTISKNVFLDNKIENLIIGNGLTNISIKAFQNNNISKLVIGNTVVGIGNYAFTNNKLTSLTIPSNVNIVGPGAFTNNPDLTQIIVKKAESDCVNFVSSWYDSNVTTVTYQP